MDTRELTPGDRRELRALVKKQSDVLRREVKQRKDELIGEIESELLRRYRGQDERVAQARREAARAFDDSVAQIIAGLNETDPDLVASLGYQNYLNVSDPNRAQLHEALIAAVPQQIADASTKLDQQELSLLRELTIGALDTGRGTIELGRNVFCDRCDTDMTDDPRSGGYLFETYAYGPCCADEELLTIRRYQEEGHIRAWCPAGMSYADWVRSLRGSSQITVRTVP